MPPFAFTRLRAWRENSVSKCRGWGLNTDPSTLYTPCENSEIPTILFALSYFQVCDGGHFFKTHGIFYVCMCVWEPLWREKSIGCRKSSELYKFICSQNDKLQRGVVYMRSESEVSDDRVLYQNFFGITCPSVRLCVRVPGARWTWRT